MEDKQAQISVYEPGRKKPLAAIVLNGYNIRAGGPLGLHGAMRSFKLLRGDLTRPWLRQSTLTLRAANGREAQVRVAALPVDKESAGLVEFL